VRRLLLLIQRVPRRWPPRRIAAVVVLGVLGVLGIRSIPHHAAPVAPIGPSPQKAGALPVGDFRELRPRAGDHMTPPRIGFRWKFDHGEFNETSSSQASMAPSVVPPFFSKRDSTRNGGTIRFVLHLIPAGGGAEVTKEADRDGVRINLSKSFPPGECEWWVEAVVPGEAPVVSPREHFVLTP
jgi:hypothetical protein